MNKVNQYIRFLVIILAGISTCGCKENDLVPEDLNKNGDMVQVSFTIPHASFGYNSRATGDKYTGNGEAVLSNLYIISVQLSYYEYKKNNNGEYEKDKDGNYIKEKEIPMYAGSESGRQRVIITPINVYNNDGVINSEDNKYALSLYPGKYRFYAFANCDLYTNNEYSASGSYSEEELKQVALYYHTDTPLTKGHLPMACEPKNVQYSINNGLKVSVETNIDSNYDYAVSIERGEDKTIYANMHFLCAKVRYTILFDDTQAIWDSKTGKYLKEEGISAGFGENSIRFYVDATSSTHPTAYNLRNTTYFVDRVQPNINDWTDYYICDHINAQDGELDVLEVGENVLTSIASWPLELGRYQWPDNGVSYPASPFDELKAYTGSLDDWKKEVQRVWQGVAYLPENNGFYGSENLSEDIKNKLCNTVLRFPYVMDLYPDEEEERPYVDGERSENDYKEITLFGNNHNQQYSPDSEDNMTYKDSYGNLIPDDSWAEGLKRGYFYDVVARVINPDRWDLEIIVSGKIEQWHEMEQNVMEGDNPSATDSSTTQ